MAKEEGVAVKVSIAAEKVGNQIKDTNKQLDDMGSKLDKISKLTVKAFKTTGIIAFGKAISNVINSMMQASKAQAEYAENLNLLNNAYGEVNNSGRELIETMERYFGLDPSNVTRQLGVFRQMSSAMNIVGDSADMLSENFTKMAEDISSLYNLDYSVAAKKLQSAFAGQVRPVRELGADITQAALQQELYNLGIDEQVKNLNRASKSVLIYLALERQLTNAQGDAANTIESMANQMRVFKEQVAIAGRQIGAVFIPILKTILPIANAILMVFNDIMSIILTFLGADVDSIAPDINKASQSYYDLGDSLDDVGASAKGAGKAIKDLNKTSLRSFDKLNNIQTPQKASGGASGGGVGGGKIGGVDSRLLDRLKEYNLGLDETLMKARKIADWIEKWIMYTDENGKKHLNWLGKILTFLGIGGLVVKGVKTIKSIWDGIGKILGTGGSVGKGVKDVAEKTSLIKKIINGFSIGELTLIGAGTATYANATYKATSNVIDNLKEGKGLWESWYNLSGGVQTIASKIYLELMNMGQLGPAFMKVIAKMDEDLNNMFGINLLPRVSDLVENTIPNLATAIDMANRSATNMVRTELDELEATKQLANGLEDLFDKNGKVKDGEEYRVKYSLEQLNQKLGTNYKLVNGQITQNGKVIKDIKEITKQTQALITKKQAEILLNAQEENYKRALEERSKALKGIVQTQDKINELKEKNTTLSGKEKEANEILIRTLETGLQNLKGDYNAANDEVSRYEDLIAAAESGNTELVQQLMKDFGYVVGEEAEKATAMVNGIPQYCEIDAKVDTSEIDGTNGINAKTKAATKEASKNKITPKVELDKKDIANQFVAAFKGKTMKVTTTKSGEVHIDYKADGGFVDKGQMFVAREAGPELVGRIGNKTAVANNDQIVDAISIGVAKAMMSTSSSTNVIIKADADTSGLLNFINFEQQQKNRQYGL